MNDIHEEYMAAQVDLTKCYYKLGQVLQNGASNVQIVSKIWIGVTIWSCYYKTVQNTHTLIFTVRVSFLFSHLYPESSFIQSQNLAVCEYKDISYTLAVRRWNTMKTFLGN